MRGDVKPLAKWCRTGCQATAAWMAIAVLNVCASTVPAAPERRSATGSVSAVGAVEINRSPVISGQTFFSGSNILTRAESGSTLTLANLARLKLEAETSLTIEFSALGLAVSVDKGTVSLFIPGGVRAGIKTADASITNESDQPAVFRMATGSGATTLWVETGRVVISSGTVVRSLTAGEGFSTAAPQLPPGTPHHLSKRKKVGLIVGIGGAFAILLIALSGEDPVEELDFGGCVIVSGTTGGGC